MSKGTVFLGMSGGVDSSVAALLLKEQGYKVIGVFIKVWHPEFLPCHWEQERLDAMRVAAHLEIPFITCNAEQAYKEEVAHYFIEEYKKGRTPNPDVMCNTHIKFGHFYRFARERGADYIATGHYAHIERDKDITTIHRGRDPEKDQSYFLWNISDEILSHVLFPLGKMTKAEVRTRARRAGIPTAQKNDSQGICFLGHVDIHDFLSHYIELEEGMVLNEEGEHIGTHRGALIYTEGQRHGFSINPHHTNTEPYFVIKKDISSNTITVSHTKRPLMSPTSQIHLTQVTWHTDTSHPPSEVLCQFRYRQKPLPGIVREYTKNTVLLEIDTHGELTSPGQSCVLYVKDRMIGGGIIEQSIT